MVHSFKADVCFLEVVKPGGFTSKSRINGCCFVTTFLKVSDVLLNAVLEKNSVYVLCMMQNQISK